MSLTMRKPLAAAKDSRRLSRRPIRSSLRRSARSAATTSATNGGAIKVGVRGPGQFPELQAGPGDAEEVGCHGFEWQDAQKIHQEPALDVLRSGAPQVQMHLRRRASAQGDREPSRISSLRERRALSAEGSRRQEPAQGERQCSLDLVPSCLSFPTVTTTRRRGGGPGKWGREHDGGCVRFSWCRRRR